MCGILGVVSTNPIVNRSWLASGISAISHRGPDDSGELWSDNGCVGFGHRRLSIIDLSDAGHQPMVDKQRGLAITFNGEIYNFKELRKELEQQGFLFRSNTDTEVIISAYARWGTGCLSHLNGMFAFAIHDMRRNIVFLARDRAGEKPLFYRCANDVLYFGSELKAILADPSLPRQIDEVALDYFLAFGYVPGDRCILKGYNKLAPGHAMVFRLKDGIIKQWRYWELPVFIETATSVENNELLLLNELEALLEDAVARQLVADVPVGILLSGGVDSSLVTAMAVRASSKIKTFTVGFPGHGVMDETAHAQLIAQHFNTDHTELMADPSTVDLLPFLARQFDEPIADDSIIPTFLVSRLVRQQCTVALGGDGGDELFGGYHGYNRQLWLQRRFGMINAKLRRAIAFSAEHFMPIGAKGQGSLQALGTDLTNGVPFCAPYFSAASRRRLLDRAQLPDPSAEIIHCSLIPEGHDLIQRATRLDFSNCLPDDILVKVDRSSMINSLEVRSPLLDYRIIEFAFSRVPSHLKTTIRERKVLLKRLTERLLPAEFDRKRKQGFSVPLRDWLAPGPFRDFFRDILLSNDCFFQRRQIEHLFNAAYRGSNGNRIFALVIFELWRRTYKISH